MKLVRLLGALFVCALALPVFSVTAPNVTISVDATSAPRKIFHATLRIPATPGTLTLYYPKWIPGEHAPDGPVIDLTGLILGKRKDVEMAPRLARRLDHPRRSSGRRERSPRRLNP